MPWRVQAIELSNLVSEQRLEFSVVPKATQLRRIAHCAEFASELLGVAAEINI